MYNIIIIIIQTSYFVTHLKPSYFSSTPNLVIFAGKNLAYFYFSDFTKNWEKFAFTYIHTHTCVQVKEYNSENVFHL